MANFEGKNRRMPEIEKCLKQIDFETLEQADEFCKQHGIDCRKIVKQVQAIAFENAAWAYTLGTAVALKSGAKTASEAAEKIGIGLEAFCIPGSVA